MGLRPQFVLFSLVLAAGANAQALRVPSQFATIGAALAAAQSGQTVLVAPGTYNERLVWPGVDAIRLIGEDGAANTTIDGGLGGTVITFASGLTRATLLQGFTITNGLLGGNANRGAGLAIHDTSPTVCNNRITANTCSGGDNRGAAIAVTGTSDPRIAHNEIDDNENRDGSWNCGAGIYLAAQHAEIVGNWIHDNRNRTSNAAIGQRSCGGGIYCVGAALIASNMITGNRNDWSTFNYGGGIFVDWSVGPVTAILNNTIADNAVGAGVWSFGGGVFVNDHASATLRGNIVAGNTGEGIYRAPGIGSGVLDSDFDCAWNNSAGNYGSTTAGSNSISVDPQFVGANDFHLTALSPCIDAIPNAHLPVEVGTDFDGDPRQIDLGPIGNTMVDIGADEFSQARLEIVGAARIGTSHGWWVTTAQPRTSLFALSFSAGHAVIPPYGNLLLWPSAVLTSVFSAPGGFALAIPNDPGLRGVTIFGQSLVLAASGPGGQFSNRASVAIH